MTDIKSEVAEPDGQSEIKEAAAPFNRRNVDVILRSCDSVDFRVWKAILTEASPFFEDLFSLPQPDAQDSGQQPSDDGLPIIPMSEDSAVLDSLLRLCYPTRDPEFESLEKLRPIMEAAVKFLMEEPLRRLKERLLIFAVESPIRVYAIAIKCGWEEEARKAARCCLNYSMNWSESDIPELQEINGVAYHRILDYHRQCSAAAKDLCSDSYQWIDTQEQWAFLECGACIATQGQQIFKDNVRRTPRGWWTRYMGMFEVWLGSRPSGATIIKASQNWPIDEKPEIEAMTCKTCKGKVHRQMAAFSKRLAAEVDRVTSQVCLHGEYYYQSTVDIN